jgi:hypothetical protein
MSNTYTITLELDTEAETFDEAAEYFGTYLRDNTAFIVNIVRSDSETGQTLDTNHWEVRR